jgi:hypothetical protein
MRNAPTTWADYIAWAADRVTPRGRRGGVATLARLSGLNRDTLFQWKMGRNADTPTVGHIRAIAEAVGDDVRNAMRAAGRVAAPDEEPSAANPPARPAPHGATLAEQLRTIRESGLPIEVQIEAAAELVALYRQPAPSGEGPEPGRRASA